MIKLRPRYYGVWLGIVFGVILSLSAIAQQYKSITEQEATLISTRAELKEFILTKAKEVSIEQVKIDARQFLEMKIKENPVLKDQIYAEADGLAITKERNISYSSFFMSGAVVVFGSLMYLARKKQKFGGFKYWLVLEILGFLIVAWHIFIGVSQARWYSDPIFYFAMPLWVALSYTALFFMRPVDATVKN